MADKDISLVEIGPRFVLNVIRIFEGSFRGATVYANPEFVSPTMVSVWSITPITEIQNWNQGIL